MFSIADVLGGLVPRPRGTVRQAEPASALALFRLEAATAASDLRVVTEPRPQGAVLRVVTEPRPKGVAMAPWANLRDQGRSRNGEIRANFRPSVVCAVLAL
jgi:hypothetical protein